MMPATMEDLSPDLIDLLSQRGDRRTMGGCGIRTAADFVSGVLSAAGRDDAELLKLSAQRLVYSNDRMSLGESPYAKLPSTCDALVRTRKDAGARTLMTFENMVTTPLRDRDGDILRSEGAVIDPKMPLLWQHVPAMPVGKMVKVLSQSKKGVKVLSALIDSQLGNDAAALIEFGALRISHGFRPLEFEELKDGGFDIKKFEVMEESLVTVPSNTDAVITAFSRGKLHDPLVKSWARSMFDARPVAVPTLWTTGRLVEELGRRIEQIVE